MASTLHGKDPVIAPGSLILVTGANGYIGSHIADQLIRTGYRVRGTVREKSKAAWLEELFDDKYGKGKFEYAIVADMAQPGAYDQVCEDVSGVVHVASIISLDPNPNNVIPQTIAGAVNAAESAAKQPSVKRFVYTSSSTAITNTRPNERFEIDAKNWNTSAIEKAWKVPYAAERSFFVYGASKTLAEQAIWKFAKEKKRGFVVNAVLPYANMGEILSDQQPASTGAWVKTIYQGGFDKGRMIDVKDTARLHVSALIDTDVENERISAFAEPFNMNNILAHLRRLYVDRTFPKDTPDAPRDLCTCDNSRGAELLKAHGRDGYTSMEESVKENLIGVR